MSLLDKSSILLTPTAYNNGSINSVIPSNGEADFDFSRGSSATRVNEQGLIEDVASNIPRIDYTSGQGALLLEPQRTNLMTYSEDYSSFTKFGCSVISNDTTFIGGGLADKIQEDSSNTNKHVRPANISITSGQSYIMSAWFKTDNCDVIALREGSSSGDSITYKFSTGTTSSIGTRWTSLNVINYSNGWRRIEAKYTSTSTASMNFRVHLLGNNYNQLINPNPSTYTYQGDGTSGIYMWGLSLEQGSYATSYTPTAGSTVTRSADVAINSGNADLFNDSEGVLYAEISALVNDATFRQISITDGSNNTIRVLYNNVSNEVRGFSQLSGTTQGDIRYELNSILSFSKIAFKYKLNEFALWINGVKVGTDTGSTPIGLSNLEFANGLGVENFYGNVKSVAVFKEALTDAELESLTSWISFVEMATDLEYTIE